MSISCSEAGSVTLVMGHDAIGSLASAVLRLRGAASVMVIDAIWRSSHRLIRCTVPIPGPTPRSPRPRSAARGLAGPACGIIASRAGSTLALSGGDRRNRFHQRRPDCSCGRRGNIGGAVLIAEHQTAGRGRQWPKLVGPSRAHRSRCRSGSMSTTFPAKHGDGCRWLTGVAVVDAVADVTGVARGPEMAQRRTRRW